jgi:signal transduction histidine kinase/DNA-binding response OmpR family regulator
MRKIAYYLGIVVLFLITSCQADNTPVPAAASLSEVCFLTNDQTDFRLEWHVQVLKDTTPGYTIRQIIQPSFQSRFQAYPEYLPAIKNYQYYWGKLQIENRLTNAGQYQEWVLAFNDTWTNLDFFIKDENGAWRQERSGAFTAEQSKKFAPTASGNLIKLILPPHKIVTVYFRGTSERTAIYPSFYARLKHIQTFYDALLTTKISNAIFIGLLLMMLFYNLIVYFFGRDRSFIYYSGYLIMVVIYATYSSDDLSDWFGLFTRYPAYERFMKLSIYLAMMSYLAFIRSFLDLKQLLPKWDTVFKLLIYVGFPLMVLDVIVLLQTNFSYVIEDRVVVPYIILMLTTCCSILYPLYKTKDKKGYFAIAGITAICLGAVISVISRVWMPPFSIFYLKAGTVVEILIFSLGLAYRQRQQKQSQQQADFKLKASLLIQEKRQVEADRLKEVNEFKARFYTNITHEFRTPLTVIMGMTENIKNHKIEKELIRRNGHNLLRLINQMLALTKLESGTLTFKKVHKDIMSYLQYLTESFYSAAAQKNIRLVFYSEEKEVMMDHDEETIQQIVYNLLSNALKFTNDRGQIIFHVNKIEENGQPILKLIVRDNGIGISQADINFIFDRFYQIDAAGTKAEGAGIGLALTKELVELMKGRIEVKSCPGEGTEFILHLPIEAQAKSTAGGLSTEPDNDQAGELLVLPSEDHTPSADQSDESFGGSALPYFADRPEVLIIEDNQDIIAFIQTILKHKYQIHTANNGISGIEKAVQIIPDIIISDVMMPGKSGYEVCEILKQDERTSHVPIILLTARATQTDRVDGLKYGADAYLTKPFDKEELMIRLEKLVEIRQQLQQRYTNSLRSKEPSVDDFFLQKLNEHLQASLSDAEFGVAQLAEASDMSQMQMYRKLKAITGKTPSQFIRSYRVHKGLELLQKGDLTISEVAYEVGFADPSYFSRVFQKELGKSPSHLFK